jgi:multiple sugar transport system substrate-binding protein
MKRIFLVLLSSLICFSQYMVYRPTTALGGAAAPVLYWACDTEPIRKEQVRLFRSWLAKRGYPDIDVRIDSANKGLQKTIIQGVTGVSCDLIDTAGQNVRYLKEIGILEDLTDLDSEFRLPPERFYPTMRDDYFIEGRCYAFPANVGNLLYLVNRDAFRKVGMEPPPERIGVDAFEALAREYVRRANPGKPRQRTYFTDRFDDTSLRESAGVSSFNETLTASALNDGRYVALLERIGRWIREEHLAPTASEATDFSVEQAVKGGWGIQLFNKGVLATFLYYRMGIVHLRALGARFDLATMEPPNGGFPTTFSGGRVCAIYKGSPHKQLAKYFIAFLASEEYNRHIVEAADAMPPSPRYLDAEEFLHPKGYRHEWDLHAGFARAARTISFPVTYSPFLSPNAHLKRESDALGAYWAGVATAGQAVSNASAAIDRAILEDVRRHPERQAAFLAAQRRQRQVDELKRSGKKLPAALVQNTFLLRYYRHTGMLQE